MYLVILSCSWSSEKLLSYTYLGQFDPFFNALSYLYIIINCFNDIIIIEFILLINEVCLIMLTQAEQRNAAKEFSKKWSDTGYEKGDSARFWLGLLSEVYGISCPSDYIKFEERVKLDNTSFIYAYIPSTHVLIEQKSINKDLKKAIRQRHSPIGAN